ncbi:hypothetical protein PGT21_008371 [Puccinia graminis f. sp. tritici]|uniref:Uncharacterized protein n=1 Tax=Puccinia graminis f. sp. tritici TaxID=56615 RepID=A0A5B0QI68_PUCGR|nr:hypothetical protein PGT21_008371 [Puccinia graminis f. sp. tritici]
MIDLVDHQPNLDDSDQPTQSFPIPTNLDDSVSPTLLVSKGLLHLRVAKFHGAD